MKCRRAEELFSDLREGSLPTPLRTELEQHLKSCPDCSSLMDCFHDVVDTLESLPRPLPSPDLVGRIIEATRTKLGTRQDELSSVSGFALPPRINWAIWAAAAAFVMVLFLRPPAFLSSLGEQMNRMGHQSYSFGLRLYQSSERLIDELNVLRMTVGVAFEDRLDRISERLKDLEEARRKSGDQPEETSTLDPSFKPTNIEASSTFADPRSTL
jgi:hypothetical protein